MIKPCNRKKLGSAIACYAVLIFFSLLVLIPVAWMVSTSFKTEPETIRKETEETVKACLKYGCPCEFVLKDISTVSHRPENLIVWTQTVSDVLDEYYGD